MTIYIIIFVIFFIKTIQCSPFDDGKYIAQKYSHDDGKYSRPTDEGKYVPGDEGRYTYIYRQGLYPDDNGDYRYVHVIGPNGPGDGPPGAEGLDGTGGSNWNGYIGHRIYAEEYPYKTDDIKSFTKEFVSTKDVMYEPDASFNQYENVNGGNENKSTDCVFLETSTPVNTNDAPSHLSLLDGNEIGSYYNFQGTKRIVKVSESAKTKKTIKLQYEISVRVVDEETELIA